MAIPEEASRDNREKANIQRINHSEISIIEET